VKCPLQGFPDNFGVDLFSSRPVRPPNDPLTMAPKYRSVSLRSYVSGPIALVIVPPYAKLRNLTRNSNERDIHFPTIRSLTTFRTKSSQLQRHHPRQARGIVCFERPILRFLRREIDQYGLLICNVGHMRCVAMLVCLFISQDPCFFSFLVGRVGIDLPRWRCG